MRGGGGGGNSIPESVIIDGSGGVEADGRVFGGGHSMLASVKILTTAVSYLPSNCYAE